MYIPAGEISKSRNISGWQKQAPSKPFDEFIETAEKKVIELALKRTNNVQNRVTDFLGVSFHSLRHRIGNHGMKT